MKMQILTTKAQRAQRNKRISGILCVLCVFVVNAVSAQAGMSVSPIKQEITVKPGQDGVFYINVANPGNPSDKVAQKPCSVNLEVVDFLVSSEGGLSFVKPGTARYSASKWIKLSKASTTVQPDETERIAFTVSPPGDVKGEFYSAIMVTQAGTVKSKGGVGLQFQIVSGIYLTVPGRTFPVQVDVIAFGPCLELADGILEPGLVISATVLNKGRVRFVPDAEARILRADKSILARIPLTAQRAEVLPGDIRILTGKLKRPLGSGEYILEVLFDCGQWTKLRQNKSLTVSADAAQRWSALAEILVLEAKPASISEKIVPGSFRTYVIEITNPSPEKIFVETKFLTAAPDNDIDWITVKPGSFLLGAGQKQNVQVVLQPPEHGNTGMYKVNLVFLPAKEKTERERSPDYFGTRVRGVDVPIEIELSFMKPR